MRVLVINMITGEGFDGVNSPWVLLMVVCIPISLSKSPVIPRIGND